MIVHSSCTLPPFSTCKSYRCHREWARYKLICFITYLFNFGKLFEYVRITSCHIVAKQQTSSSPYYNAAALRSCGLGNLRGDAKRAGSSFLRYKLFIYNTTVISVKISRTVAIYIHTVRVEILTLHGTSPIICN